MSGRLRWRLRWRLSVLWALEWGITGAILTYLPLYLEKNDLTRIQQGQLLAVAAVGLWVAPFIVGQVCDRWMASEKYLAIAHFVGGVTLYCIPIAMDVYKQTHANFGVLLALIGLYAVAYFPTVPLASSLSFRHLPDPDEQFGSVRIWGTVGWVMSGLALSFWLDSQDVMQFLRERLPGWQPFLARVGDFLNWIGQPDSSDSFRISAILSFALSSFCIFLPATPPARTQAGSLAPIETLRTFRDRTFTLLIVISLLLAAVVSFYTLGVPHLLHERGFHSEWVPAAMTIGQISEFPALLLLPLCLKRFGLKYTFALGMAAWVIRYGLFAYGGSQGLVLFGIGLHGICHVFLVIVIQLFIDERSRLDLRASTQNLFAFVTAGIGMPVGFVAAGEFARYCEDDVTGAMNFQWFFALPAVLVALLAVAFLVLFQETPRKGDGGAEISQERLPASLVVPEVAAAVNLLRIEPPPAEGAGGTTIGK